MRCRYFHLVQNFKDSEVPVSSTAESLTLPVYPFAEMVRMYDSQASYNVTAAKIMVRLADNVAL